MNPNRFYMPASLRSGNLPTSVPMIRASSSIPRNVGLFSRLTNGICSVNWGGLLNNANKTLDVVNQTIPLIRQAKPMVNNMRSMLRIAKAFGSETTNAKSNNLRNNYIQTNSNTITNGYNNILSNEKEVQNDNIPNFFV